jgi:hypothetical protein
LTFNILFLRNDKRAARSTMTIALCGLKFFYDYVLLQPWPLLDEDPWQAGRSLQRQHQ